MPIKNARYRTKTTKTGKKIRLAFKGNKVVEAKNLKTGKIHTPVEFKRDKIKNMAKTKKKIAKKSTKKVGKLSSKSSKMMMKEKDMMKKHK